MTPQLCALTEYCQVTYGVPPMHVRILVSALLPTRYPPLWFLVQAENSPFFDHFAYVIRQMKAYELCDTWMLRADRPWNHNKRILVHLQTRDTDPRYYVDRYWRLPGPQVRVQSRYPLVAQECIRMRFEWDPIKQPEYQSRDKLLKLITEALGAAYQDRGGVVPVEVPAAMRESFQRKMMILMMCDRYLCNRTSLARNLLFIPASHMALCGRTAMNDLDYRALAHVLKSGIPFWMERMITVFMHYNQTAISKATVVRESGLLDPWHRGANQMLREPLRGTEKLIRDLMLGGLLEQTHNNRNYRLKPEHVTDVEELLQGKI